VKPDVANLYTFAAKTKLAHFRAGDERQVLNVDDGLAAALARLEAILNRSEPRSCQSFIGADVVQRALAEDAVIGALSLGEVLSKLTDSGEDPDPVLDAITRLPLGDRASLALGLRLGRRVLTANAA
jgi:hypothetical protein